MSSKKQRTTSCVDGKAPFRQFGGAYRDSDPVELQLDRVHNSACLGFSNALIGFGLKDEVDRREMEQLFSQKIRELQQHKWERPKPNYLADVISPGVARSICSFLDGESHMVFSSVSKAMSAIASAATSWPPDVVLDLEDHFHYRNFAHLRPRSLVIGNPDDVIHNFSLGFVQNMSTLTSLTVHADVLDIKPLAGKPLARLFMTSFSNKNLLDLAKMDPTLPLTSLGCESYKQGFSPDALLRFAKSPSGRHLKRLELPWPECKQATSETGKTLGTIASCLKLEHIAVNIQEAIAMLPHCRSLTSMELNMRNNRGSQFQFKWTDLTRALASVSNSLTCLTLRLVNNIEPNLNAVFEGLPNLIHLKLSGCVTEIFTEYRRLADKVSFGHFAQTFAQTKLLKHVECLDEHNHTTRLFATPGAFFEFSYLLPALQELTLSSHLKRSLGMGLDVSKLASGCVVRYVDHGMDL